LGRSMEIVEAAGWKAAAGGVNVSLSSLCVPGSQFAAWIANPSRTE
jgi:hypothetical protein